MGYVLIVFLGWGTVTIDYPRREHCEAARPQVQNAWGDAWGQAAHPIISLCLKR
jgi:hypothetical protein